jgi:outer membrane immunogenic protein
MKSKILGAIAAFALSSVATFAADMPVKAPVAVAYTYNWTGLYIGAHAGGGWSNPSYTNVANTSTFGGAAVGSSFSQNGSGFIGGGQIGYNWQAGSLVYGVEASFSGSTIKANTTNFVDDLFENKLNSLLLVTGRLGYAYNNWLLYGKGGYAGGNRRVSVSDTGVVSPGIGSGSATAWHSGWTLGAGFEYGLTQNWILGLGYDFVSLGSSRYQLDGTDGGGLSYLFDVKSNYHLVTTRLSYKF